MSTLEIFTKTPSRAKLLRRIFGNAMGIRGVPLLLWWLRRITFPKPFYLIETPDGFPAVINRDDYAELMLFYFPYCPELIKLLSDMISPGENCLDLGANVGVITACMALCVGKSGKVISVEPNPHVAVQLLTMTSAHYPENVVVASVGIAGKDGTGMILQPPGSFSQSIEVMETSNDGPQITLLSIDTLIQQYLNGLCPDFIKVDIEGNESYLIESMQNLLTNGCRPALLIEAHPQKCERKGVNIGQVFQKLVDSGYQARRVDRYKAGYHLCIISSEPIGHDNYLFVTPAYLNTHKELAAKWSDSGSRS